MNDTGTAWLALITLGTAASSSNGQCTVSAAGSSASGSGNILTLNLAVTFRHTFAGTKTIYLAAQDKTGASSDWQVRGRISLP